jgi:hypothetical protein
MSAYAQIAKPQVVSFAELKSTELPDQALRRFSSGSRRAGFK